MRIVDNLIALRIIYLLVTPFDQTDAYKLGLIDDKGRNLKKASTGEEKKATSMLHRLVWNIKRIISLAPGGSSKIGSLTAAYLLVKEAYEEDWSDIKLQEQVLLKYNPYSQIRFVQEEILVESCMKKIKKLQSEDAPANATGAATSTDIPVKKPNKKRASGAAGPERHVSDFL